MGNKDEFDQERKKAKEREGRGESGGRRENMRGVGWEERERDNILV